MRLVNDKQTHHGIRASISANQSAYEAWLDHLNPSTIVISQCVQRKGMKYSPLLSLDVKKNGSVDDQHRGAETEQELTRKYYGCVRSGRM